MATASTVALVIYDSRLFYPGAIVPRWANSIERNFVLWAKEEAPQRTGELRGGISGSTATFPPARAVEVTITSSAPHTMYVLAGTTGPIYSRRYWGFINKYPMKYPRGGGLKSQFFGPPNLPFLHSKGYALKVRAGNGFPERLALSVGGQKANQFFNRAATRVARRHSSLRGFHPITQQR